jgi:arabinan endo-1,5-alpha-L-arabinosidase
MLPISSIRSLARGNCKTNNCRMYKKKIIVLLAMLAVFSKIAYSQPWCHDPSTVVHSNGRYWVYSTGNGIAVHSAFYDHFRTYRSEPPVFSVGTFPSWIREYVPDFSGHFWAPDMFYMNGKWHLYYSCSSWGSRNSAIGLVTASLLSKPAWEDQGMVTYTTNSSNHNAIDPALFRDYEGRIWMLYGSYWNGLAITEIDSLTGKPFNRNAISFVANNNCEAGSITKHDGYYYLFFNRGSCCNGVNSTYHILVERSTSPTGPFLDKNGVDCNQSGGSSFIRSDGRFVGPGHFSRLDSLFSYHYYDAFNNGASRMKTANLRWIDGWPVADYVPEGIVPDGVYAIQNRHAQKLIGLDGNQSIDGTSVVLRSETGHVATMWNVSYTDERFYRISPYVDSSKLLEIRGCGVANGDKAICWSAIGSPCQEWYVSMMSDGYFRIANKNSHLMLEIMNAATHDGALAQQWPFNEHATQQWKFIAANTSYASELPSENGVLVHYELREKAFRISSSEDMYRHQLRVFSANGVLIGNYLLAGSEMVIEVDKAHFADGLYLLQIIDADGRVRSAKRCIVL